MSNLDNHANYIPSHTINSLQKFHCLSQISIHSGPTAVNPLNVSLLFAVSTVSSSASSPAAFICSNHSSNLIPGFFATSSVFAAVACNASNHSPKLTGSMFPPSFSMIVGTRAFQEPYLGLTILWYLVQAGDEGSSASERTSSTMMRAVRSTGTQLTVSWLGIFLGILPRYLEVAMS